MEYMWARFANAPKCKATRRDGAPCRNAVKLENGERCRVHNVRYKDKSKAARDQRRAEMRARQAQYRADKETVASAPEQLTQTPEWTEISAVSARRSLMDLVNGYAAFIATGDAIQWQATRAEVLERFRARQARQARELARRYREREELGIPHPADPKKW